jgi:RNA polymerase sigma-70 factor (ECF subfamily)
MFGIKKITITTSSDEQLLQQYVASGDSVYMGELFKRYSYIVLAICRKYLKDRESSKDEAMQVFEHMLLYKGDKKIENFSKWIYVITKNHCLMKIRKEKNIHFIEPDPHLDFEDRFHPFMGEDGLTGEEEGGLAHLEECMEGLNAFQKQCIDLFYMKENTYQAIALSTGFGIEKVKSYLQNGKRNLRMCLEGKMRHGQIQ